MYLDDNEMFDNISSSVCGDVGSDDDDVTSSWGESPPSSPSSCCSNLVWENYCVF